MKTLEQLRTDSEILLEQNALSDNNKLLTLVRSGLFDSNKLTLLKRALAKDNDKMTRVERNALLDLLDRLITVVTTDKSVYNKVRQDVMTEDSKVDIDINQIPPILILKRRAIRVFPDGQKVALYWADRINKYISVPYQSTGISEAFHADDEWLAKNPKAAKKVADKLAANDSNDQDTSAKPTPPAEEEKPIEKKMGNRLSNHAKTVTQNATTKREILRSTLPSTYSYMRDRGVGVVASAIGAAAVGVRKAGIESQMTSRQSERTERLAAKLKEAFANKVPTIIIEAHPAADIISTGLKKATSKPKATPEPKPIALDSNLRLEFAEDFISGLKTLFKAKEAPQIQPSQQQQASASDENPYEYRVQRPEKGITSKIKGNNPTRPANTIDPYEDPDSSLHQQQQNIQRRANRNFASGGGNGRTVYESIKSISEGNENGEIQIGESTVLVTPAMAKNIVKLYENVNKVNKAIIRQKLCESEQEFFKILEFAVRKV